MYARSLGNALLTAQLHAHCSRPNFTCIADSPTSRFLDPQGHAVKSELLD